MAVKILRGAVAVVGLLGTAAAAPLQEAGEGEARAVIDRRLATSTGDLGAIRKAGVVRVLTVYERNTFRVDQGVERGFEVELMRAWVDGLNADLPAGELETQLVFIPMPLEALLPALLEGRGDVVAANLTVTEQRERLVDFAEPYLTGVRELVVSAADAPPLAALEDLAGQRVFVTRGSSYAESLRDQSQRLVAAGAAPIEVVEVAATLQSEDLLELVNAGVIEHTVCDEHLARLWSAQFPNIRVHAELPVSPEREIAWAVRPTNPELLASLSAFARESARGTALGDALFARNYVDPEWIRSPIAPEARVRFDALTALFRSRTEGTGFDWLQIAAVAFEVSGLDPDLRSPSGAGGLMQLTPELAREMGCLQLFEPAQNITAGVKYMILLRDEHFAGRELEPGAQFDFCLAAYQVGPERVKEWRVLAAKYGLDPDHWFGNVEYVALEDACREVVRFVGNVNKYYFAYRMSADLLEARSEARDELSGDGAGTGDGG